MDCYGRRTIYVAGEINEETIVEKLNRAYGIHCLNKEEIEYLSDYARGKQPVLYRTKNRNEDINNKVCENHAKEIIDFKDGYFLPKPATYVARHDEAIKKVKELNDFIKASGKNKIDNKVVHDFHKCGVGYIYVEVTDVGNDEVPFECYRLDPRNAFVCYSLGYGNKPVMGVSIVEDDNKIYADVFTKDKKYTLVGTLVNSPTDDARLDATFHTIESVETNQIGTIPIVEYNYDTEKLGAFEPAIPLLDAINEVQSDRVDGIDQFIQNLIVATNVDFDDGVTAQDIKKSGMVCLKSSSDCQATIQVISEELDQQQTQELIDSLYKQALNICAMPVVGDAGGSTSDTASAVLYRNGWQNADASARNTEDLFRESNAYFDDVALAILKAKKKFKIKRSDYDLAFCRTESSGIQTKAQALYTLLSAGLAPELAFEKSGISSDPTNDVEISKEYLEARWKPQDNAEQATGQQPEAELKFSQDKGKDPTKVDMKDAKAEGRTEQLKTDTEKNKA